MNNPHSSDTIAEDMIRVITQLACTEAHLKTLIEKSIGKLENGLIDVETELQAELDKQKDMKEELVEIAQLRRENMIALYEMYEGDKDYWCMVKHLAQASYTAFEVWQASEDDPVLFNIAINTNKRFVKAVTHFLGVEITECAACLGDLLKAKGETE